MTVTDEFIEHYGVKGMKWGVRKSRRLPVGSKEARKRDASIDKARENIRTGKSAERLQRAKTAYRHDKVTLGKKEAKRQLNKAKLKNVQELQKSLTAKDGKEFTTMLIADLATGGNLTALNIGVNLSAKRLQRKVNK